MCSDKYKRPQTIESQIMFLANQYMRHGSKINRRKQVRRLIHAAELVCKKYGLKNVRQIGKRQIHWYDEQLHSVGQSEKNRLNYWYAWNLLWQWLNYHGEPPKPK